MEDIFEKIKDIFVDQTDVEDEIFMDSNLMNDLGLTSMDVFTAVAEIKKKFKITVPEKDLRSFVTMGDIVRYVASK